MTVKGVLPAKATPKLAMLKAFTKEAKPVPPWQLVKYLPLNVRA